MPPGGDFLYAEEGRGRAARAKHPAGSVDWEHQQLKENEAYLDTLLDKVMEDVEKHRPKRRSLDEEKRSLDEAYRYGLQGPLALELPVLLEAIRGMLGRGEMTKFEDQEAMEDKARGDFVGAYDKAKAMERDPENVEIRRMIAESGGMMRPAVRDRLVHQMLRAKEREDMLWNKLKETQAYLGKTPAPPLAYEQYGEEHPNSYAFRSIAHGPAIAKAEGWPARTTYHYPWREE